MSTVTKQTGINARSSAALPAAGAFDTAASALQVPIAEMDPLTVYVQYTQGAAGGACRMTWQTSEDSTTWFSQTIDEGQVSPVTVGSQSYGETQLDVVSKRFPAGTGNYKFSFSAPRGKYIRVLFAECGVTATPGTVAASVGGET